MTVYSFLFFNVYMAILNLQQYLMFACVFVYSGSKIFSTFIGFLKSKDPNDGTEQALLNELSSFNDYLKENV